MHIIWMTFWFLIRIFDSARVWKYELSLAKRKNRQKTSIQPHNGYLPLIFPVYKNAIFKWQIFIIMFDEFKKSVKVGIKPFIPPREILKVVKITYFSFIAFLIFFLLYVLYHDNICILNCIFYYIYLFINKW